MYKRALLLIFACFLSIYSFCIAEFPYSENFLENGEFLTIDAVQNESLIEIVEHLKKRDLIIENLQTELKQVKEDKNTGLPLIKFLLIGNLIINIGLLLLLTYFILKFINLFRKL